MSGLPHRNYTLWTVAFFVLLLVGIAVIRSVSNTSDDPISQGLDRAASTARSTIEAPSAQNHAAPIDSPVPKPAERDPARGLAALFKTGGGTIILDTNPEWVENTLSDLLRELEAAASPTERLGLLRGIVESPLLSRFPDEEDIRKGGALLHLVTVSIEDETLTDAVYEIVKGQVLRSESDLATAYAIAAIYGVSPPFLLVDFNRGRQIDLRLSALPGNNAPIPTSPTLAALARDDIELEEALGAILARNRAVSISEFALDALHAADPAAFHEKASALDLLKMPFLAVRVVDHLLADQTQKAIEPVVAFEAGLLAEDVNSIPWVSQRLASYGIVSSPVMERAIKLLRSEVDIKATDECSAGRYLCAYLAIAGDSPDAGARQSIVERLSGGCSTTFANIVIGYVRAARDTTFVPSLRSSYSSATPYARDLIADVLRELDPNSQPYPSVTHELRNIDAQMIALENASEFDKEAWDELDSERGRLSAELSTLRKASGNTSGIIKFPQP